MTVTAPAPRRPVDELALRRQQRRTRVLTVLVAAVVAAALALGGVVYWAGQRATGQVAQQALKPSCSAHPTSRSYRPR